MSDKVVGKIFVTSWKNYKKFRDNENNRNLDERHVAKLVASFRKNGWDIEPITVNKDYVIISGHHRLAAAVQAEIDIKYTIADVDYTSTQLQDISSTQKKWTERDVIASKAKAGSIAHQNYIQPWARTRTRPSRPSRRPRAITARPSSLAMPPARCTASRAV